MFDNLRQKSAEQAEFMTEEEDAPVVAGSVPRTGPMQYLLGLTPAQRLILAVMLFLNVTVLGCLALLALERIAF